MSLNRLRFRRGVVTDIVQSPASTELAIGEPGHLFASASVDGIVGEASFSATVQRGRI